MKTIICTSTIPWLSPFYEFSLFEPILQLNTPINENLSETAFAYNYSYKLPSFRKKDVQLSVHNNVLTIEGSHKNRSFWWSKSKNNVEQHFVKKLNLSNDVDCENISAKFKNEVLTIEIPKKYEFVSYREIPISGTTSDAKKLSIDNSNSVFNKWRLRFNKLLNKIS